MLSGEALSAEARHEAIAESLLRQSIETAVETSAIDESETLCVSQNTPEDFYSHASTIDSECTKEYDDMVQKVINSPDPAEGVKQRLRYLGVKIWHGTCTIVLGLRSLCGRRYTFIEKPARWGWGLGGP